MKLLIFAAVLTVAVAIPWKREMPKEEFHKARESGSVEETKFGRCTSKQFVRYGQDCLRKFAQSFRLNPTTDCYKQYDRQMRCAVSWVRYCLNGVVPEKEMNSIIASTTGTVSQQWREVYCGKGKIVLPTLETPFCDKEFHDTVKMYMIDFIKMFRHKPSDPKLCDEYTFVVRSFKKLFKTHCKAEASASLSWILSPDSNPFCPKEA